MVEVTSHYFLQITQHHVLHVPVHKVMQEISVNIGLNHVVVSTMAVGFLEYMKIFDDGMKLFDVFCDFDLNSTNAWTLVQSYQLKNKDSFD